MKRVLLVVLGGPALIAAHSFGTGVLGYLDGTAHFKGVGYPGYEYSNLDPDYRVRRRTSGCRVSGIEVLTHLPNNTAVTAMVNVFGPMKGVYRGPYPTRDEAREALRTASTIVDASMIGWAGYPDLEDGCAALEGFVPIDGMPVARCAVFEDQTIILGHRDRASLIDRATGEPYARYRIR